MMYQRDGEIDTFLQFPFEEWEKRAEGDKNELEFCDKMRQLRPNKKANVKTKTTN